MKSLPAAGLATLVLACTAPAPPAADAPPGSDRAARVRGITEEATREFNRDADRAVERIPALQDRMMAVAEEGLTDATGLEALHWVLCHNFSPAAMKRASRAADLLVEHHLKHPDLKYACGRIADITDPPDQAVRLLKAIRAGSPHDVTRAEALLALAGVLNAQANAAADRAARERLYKEAEDCLEEVREKYPDLRLWDRVDRYRDRAGRLLREVRHLSVGRAAPEVEGETLDGKALRLSGYRGRVVLLVFGKAGCPGCVELYPHQRELLGRMAGRPFEVVGVHGGEEKDLAAVRALFAKHKVDWPVVWSRAPVGESSVEDRWNVGCYPTVYLIDADGVIRLKAYGSPGPKALGAAATALVEEAEARAGRP